MRRFHSYGPVDCDEHFCVARTEMIDRCAAQLVGNPEKGGHFFTIWSPRQCGKTWLMRQAADRIAREQPDRFTIAMMSMQGIVLEGEPPSEAFFSRWPLLVQRFFRMDIPAPGSWEEFGKIFSVNSGWFDKPLILFIDEFDKLPSGIIDNLVGVFRDMYLDREHFRLHGLALIGVRAVLGVDSPRGSPFNIQRSLHVPNFTPEEVTDLFDQYQAESGQRIDADVVRSVFEATRGQPGLVGWFGELLTETFNPGPEAVIDPSLWNTVFARALHKEWNNTILNLVKKARGPYAGHVLQLFSTAEMPFSIHAEWCAYLYLNGIIDSVESVDESTGKTMFTCRFASPFVQSCLYDALTMDLVGDNLPILALDPLDDLADVFDTAEIDLPALLERYRAYLARLKARGLNPWQDQPRRSDLRYTEAVGHFHLYFWLQNAVGRLCGVSPEFPTGNGRVDLHLRCKDRRAVIEVKSFRDQAELRHSRDQAVNYARRLGLPSITLALFAPLEDEDILARLSGTHDQDGVRLYVVAIGWV